MAKVRASHVTSIILQHAMLNEYHTFRLEDQPACLRAHNQEYVASFFLLQYFNYNYEQGSPIVDFDILRGSHAYSIMD